MLLADKYMTVVSSLESERSCKICVLVVVNLCVRLLGVVNLCVRGREFVC
jgi:hypothetical protein